MDAATQKLWDAHNKYPGDREALFAAVAEWSGARRALYPGSYIDVAASFVFPDVVYVDMDRKAKRFFTDVDGVDALIGTRADGHRWEFIGGDYREPLPLEDQSFDLLISLYAGFVSEAAVRYLRIGGHLLANTSHGDVALAFTDDRFRLVAIVLGGSGSYAVSDEIEGHGEPKDGVARTPAEIRALGRGVRYTKTAVAYLFERDA